MLKLLMLSSSRRGDENYLEHAIPLIDEHLAGCKNLVFLPFAGVTMSWDDYTDKIGMALPNYKVKGIHQFDDKKQALRDTDAILVGGGNTFNLLNEIYRQDLLQSLREETRDGTPYVGWSAGSNICGNSIRTTNDMPIIQPPSFNALELVPFQINPHYTDYSPPGHNGETRAERIGEFCALEPAMPVLGIREGTALQRMGDKLTLLGEQKGVLFLAQNQHVISPGDDLSRLL